MKRRKQSESQHRAGNELVDQPNEPRPKTGAKADADATTPAPIMTPAVNAAFTLAHWADQGQGDIDALIVSFALQGKALRQGDLTDPERMLMAQASTLDVIFHQLSRRAAKTVDQSLGACDAYLRLALRAQSQCRATLETLALIKNPQPVSIVRQANIANGPQQVNNCAPAPSRASEDQTRPNELLEHQPHVTMDPRAPQAAIRADSTMEAVGEIHRPADNHRQAARSTQRK